VCDNLVLSLGVSDGSACKRNTTQCNGVNKSGILQILSTRTYQLEITNDC